MSILYVVATPIGNLEDMSLRALRILREVGTIFCEDTRVSLKLLSHYEIEHKKLVSLNKENEEKRATELLKILDSGEDIALVSDAGTPLISDPGAYISKLIHETTNHQLVPIPGPSSLSSLLSISPIDCSRFTFEGFLPHGPKQRRRVLKRLQENIIKLEDNNYPLVFFESPHRILKTLEDIKNIFGESSQVFIARELTKKFEQHYYGSVIDILAQLEQQFPKDVQGEFVLILQN